MIPMASLLKTFQYYNMIDTLTHSFSHITKIAWSWLYMQKNFLYLVMRYIITHQIKIWYICLMNLVEWVYFGDDLRAYNIILYLSSFFPFFFRTVNFLFTSQVKETYKEGFNYLGGKPCSCKVPSRINEYFYFLNWWGDDMFRYSTLFWNSNWSRLSFWHCFDSDQIFTNLQKLRSLSWNLKSNINIFFYHMIILAILSITLWNLHYSEGKTKGSFIDLDTVLFVFLIIFSIWDWWIICMVFLKMDDFKLNFNNNQ